LFAQTFHSLLKFKCLPCHGDDTKNTIGSLGLPTRDCRLKGGNSVPALVLGEPVKFRIYIAVSMRKLLGNKVRGSWLRYPSNPLCRAYSITRAQFTCNPAQFCARSQPMNLQSWYAINSDGDARGQ
jgi:hypothetical protein